MIEDLKLNCHVCNRLLLVDVINNACIDFHCICPPLIMTFGNCQFNFYLDELTSSSLSFLIDNRYFLITSYDKKMAHEDIILIEEIINNERVLRAKLDLIKPDILNFKNQINDFLKLYLYM